MYHLLHYIELIKNLNKFKVVNLFEKLNQWFFWVNFRHFSKNIFKNEYFVTNSLFFGENFVKFFYKFKVFKNHNNCLQYEKVFKVLYFHILNITKFS